MEILQWDKYNWCILQTIEILTPLTSYTENLCEIWCTTFRQQPFFI
jgi:hypothetical protein